MTHQPPRQCPDCATPMQAYYAGTVELDRCPACWGLWFDWAELGQVLGCSFEPELIEGHTSRRCALCRITLYTALLPGGIPAETCTSCRGIYLDAGELAELG